MAQRWCIVRDKKEGLVVRRWNKGKYERLPRSKYRHLSPEELEKYIKRLNVPIDLKAKVQFKHAFIDDELLSEYEAWLNSRVPTPVEVRREVNALKKHFLNFFIWKLDLPDPASWRANQAKWASYLKVHKTLNSVQSKRRVIQAANRFMGWLHEKRPTEIPHLKFEPLSRAVFKQIQATRELNGLTKNRSYITPEAWKKIRKALPPSIAPFVLLSKYYGLRRAESLGIRSGDTKKAYLSVERQLSSISEDPVYRALKGREQRKIPHWFAAPSECYRLIEEAQDKLIHPDTLSDKWAGLMKELGYSYDFHDLRHTFITNAMRKFSPRDVQLAAGHKNIETTMRYLHDDRGLDDEEFIPETA